MPRALPLRSISAISVRRDVHLAVEVGTKRWTPLFRAALEAWGREHAAGRVPGAIREISADATLDGLGSGMRLAARHAPPSLADAADAVADKVRRATRPSASERAARIADERSAAIVTQVDDGTRAAINRVVAAGVKQGLPSQTVARLLREVVPLDERRAGALANFRARLQALGVKESVADARASRYATRLVGQRAETIARTEMQLAVEAGRVELWRELSAQDVVPESAVSQKWITSRDERVDEDCDLLDGETRELGGFSEGPPLHPSCRCTTLITAEGF